MKFLTLILAFVISWPLFGQFVNTINLSEQWTFEHSGKTYPAKVPGNIHSDLFRNQLIEDPFYADNEKDLQWIGLQTWNYQCAFEVDELLLEKSHLELNLEGLDTYAKVYLNDSLILTADNMFRDWWVDVKSNLRIGKNILRISFLPIGDLAKMQVAKTNYTLPEQERAVVRKAQYQFGWDWGPRFLTCGIWKNISLKAWDYYKIENIQIVQNQLTEHLAELTAVIQINSDGDYKLLTQVSALEFSKITKNEFQIIKGQNELKINFQIKNPNLWWCNGMGEAYLYHLFFSFADEKQRFERRELAVGLRTIKLIQKEDSLGASFYFELNGVPIFAKGSNYIPANFFPTEVHKSDYERIVGDAVKSNMNMLRVWGGGIYESDTFYQVCDEKGLMIWQDFMFAGAMYPGDVHFIENVTNEAIDNVKRLRNHPSIALWCGNNEVSEAWHNWGWQKQFQYSKTDSAEIWQNYQRLFQQVLDSIVHQEDAQRYYWPSSPSIGWGRKESLLRGDSHYWGVWWGMEPFEVYQKKVGRFMSEYGFQALPDMHTIMAFAPNTQLIKDSPSMLSHQKHPTGYQTINTYLERDYIPAYNLEDLIYKSQILQADGMVMAIEAHRRAKPYCMGTLYWQMNDCWPVVSWSGIDYYGRWKAMQYRVKKAYRNIAISVTEENENLMVYVVSDSLKDVRRSINLQLLSFRGQVIYEKTLRIDIEANSSIMVYKIPIKDLLNGVSPDSVVFAAKFGDDNNLNTICHYFTKPKNLQLTPPNINIRLEQVQDGYIMYLKSNYLTKNIMISLMYTDAILEDNYFDLLPNQEYHIFIKTQLTKEVLNSQMKVGYLFHY